jgi:putative transposase
VSFIEEHKVRFGVEPICRVLTEHGCRIAPSTYYEARSRAPSRRSLRDADLVAIIAEERRNVFVARLGARKLWLHLRRKGHDVARCTVERLLRQEGIVGVSRTRRVRTTKPDAAAARPADLIDRDFTTSAPNQLWVADFTYVPTWSGFVYVAFVLDAYSRRFVGWRCATSMSTALVLDALEHALWTRANDGITDLTGLIHHHDAGSQYTSIAFTQRLLDAGVDASVGSVGDAYDNALAETHIGLYKTEQIIPGGPWRDVNHVEAGTLEWVTWYNHERTHESIDDLTPVEVEQLHYRHRSVLAEAG